VVSYTAAMTLILLSGTLPRAHAPDLSRLKAYTDAETAAVRYSDAIRCLQSQTHDFACGKATSAGEAEQSWRQTRAEFLNALHEVDQRGSAAAADAARQLEVTIPPSVEDARRGTFDDGAVFAFLRVTCHEINLGSCDYLDTSVP
jgi:hypothetical protein